VLHTLIGYSDQPSYLQVLAYVTTFTTIFAASHIISSRRRTSVAGKLHFNAVAATRR